MVFTSKLTFQNISVDYGISHFLCTAVYILVFTSKHILWCIGNGITSKLACLKFEQILISVH